MSELQEVVKMGCIYLITNLLNNKKYVGQHNKPDPHKRWLAHLKNAKNNMPYALYNAMRHYGSDSFKIKTLTICSHDALKSLEPYYAEQYGSYVWDNDPGGYNMVWCGENFRLGITHTPEVRKRLSEAHTGRVLPAEHCEKIAAGNRGLKRSKEGCKNIRIGKLNNPISPEGMQKIIEHNTGRKMTEAARENMRLAHLRIKEEKTNGTYTGKNDEDKREFPCTYPGCTKVLPKAGSLKLHLRTHSGEKPYVCKECGVAFAVGSNLDQHMNKHNPKSFACTQCDTKLSHKRTLADHIKRFHADTITYV